MTKIDMQTRIDTEIEELKKKIAVKLKKDWDYPNLFMDSGKLSNGHYFISVENGLGSFSMEMEDIVLKSKYAIFFSRSEDYGQYDWAAETYIKDCSTVQFRF